MNKWMVQQKSQVNGGDRVIGTDRLRPALAVLWLPLRRWRQPTYGAHRAQSRRSPGPIGRRFQPELARHVVIMWGDGRANCSGVLEPVPQFAMAELVCST